MAQHAIRDVNNVEAIRLTPIGIHSGMDITLQNVSVDGYIYIGGEGVTQSDYGYRIAANHAISFELEGHDALFAIAANQTASLAVLKLNLESPNG